MYAEQLPTARRQVCESHAKIARIKQTTVKETSVNRDKRLRLLREIRSMIFLYLSEMVVIKPKISTERRCNIALNLKQTKISKKWTLFKKIFQSVSKTLALFSTKNSFGTTQWVTFKSAFNLGTILLRKRFTGFHLLRQNWGPETGLGGEREKQDAKENKKKRGGRSLGRVPATPVIKKMLHRWMNI